MISKYNDNLEKNEWKELPFKVRKRQEAAASRDCREGDRLPQIKQGLQRGPPHPRAGHSVERMVYIYGQPDHVRRDAGQEASNARSTLSADESQLGDRQSGNTAASQRAQN